MHDWLSAALAWFSLPTHGLATLFVWSLLAATLVPIGAEPALFGLLRVQPELFWPAIAVASVGNTLGAVITYGMGRAASRAVNAATRRDTVRGSARAQAWLQRFGPKACLLAWLPGVGDPLCAVAGWLRLPFWPCVMYVAIGKTARYLVVAALGAGLD